MSYTKQVTIWCDGEDCLNSFETDSSETATGARYEAEQEGWKNAGAEDYCPSCKEAADA